VPQIPGTGGSPPYSEEVIEPVRTLGSCPPGAISGTGTVDTPGVRVFAPDSTPIGHIDLPERCANLAFGGRARNRLFLAAHSSLYSLYVNVRGVR
jgi:hypothetical protein